MKILFLLRFGVAWAIAVAVYLVAAVLTVFDGMLSFIFQPIMGIIIGGLSVAACTVAGLLLRLPFLRKPWRFMMILPAVFVAVGVGLLLFSAMPSQMVQHTQVIDSGPEPYEESYVSLGDTAIPGYFALLFALANWPLWERKPKQPAA